jgi:hypothetical protein
MPKPRGLTPEQLALARGRYEAGEPLRQIAADVHMSKTGLCAALAKDGCKMRSPRGKQKVTAAMFVAAWQASESVREVAEKLGCPYGNVFQRALRYRKLGVALKAMPHMVCGGKKLDVAALNALIHGV